MSKSKRQLSWLQALNDWIDICNSILSHVLHIKLEENLGNLNYSPNGLTVFPPHWLICGSMPHIAFLFFLFFLMLLKNAAFLFSCISLPHSPSVSVSLTCLTHTAPPLHAHRVCLHENNIIWWGQEHGSLIFVQTAGESHKFMKVCYHR